MSNPSIATPVAPVVSIIDGQAVTTSLEIARVFDKRHDSVIRSIELLRSECGENHHHNFVETVTERENPSGGAPILSKAYHLTRDGFTLLAMGFTGAKALQFKLAYIQQFNAMEHMSAQLRDELRAKLYQRQAELNALDTPTAAPTPAASRAPGHPLPPTLTLAQLVRHDRFICSIHGDQFHLTPIMPDAFVATWREVAERIPHDLACRMDDVFAIHRVCTQEIEHHHRAHTPRIDRAIRENRTAYKS